MVEKSDLFSKIDAFINRNQSVLFWVSFVLTILFSILLFDIRVSLSGDDAGYLIRSNDFIYKSMYPSYQGPLYPIFISPFVYLFGINLVLLKTLSVFFILGHLFFFYRSFKDRIPALVLYFTVFIISINAYLLYFASQTYNEAFYLLVQSITVYVFVSFFIARDSENIPIKESYLRFLLLGFMLFLMGLTRSIGYGLFLSILIFYVISMRWKSIAYTFAGFFIFAVPFEFLKGLIYGNKEVLNSQLNLHLQKDFYNASKGFEDLPGFFERFLANSNLYLSKHLFMFLGFRPDDVTIKPYPLLAVTCYFIFFLAFIIIFRKNIYLLFTGIMVGVMTAITFVILQKTWDQGRLILIFYPSMLLLVFGGLYYLTKKYNLRYFQYLVVIFMGVVVFSTLGRTLERVKKQKEIVSHNLNGNLLFGLTDRTSKKTKRNSKPQSERQFIVWTYR